MRHSSVVISLLVHSPRILRLFLTLLESKNTSALREDRDLIEFSSNELLDKLTPT